MGSVTSRSYWQTVSLRSADIRAARRRIGYHATSRLPDLARHAELRILMRRAYRMGMPDVAKVWTREEVLALPEDGNRYELVDGELLVTPSPRPLHQIAVGVLNDRLRPYVREHRLGTVLSSPADLDLRAGQLLQPDIFVVRTTDGLPLRKWAQAGIPLLVVEVLSPSTVRSDRITKRRRYQRSGVPAYWIVDVDARLVEVWAAQDTAPAIIDDFLLWQPSPSVPALSIDLPGSFREIHGE